MANLEKAEGFERECDWPHTLRHANLAATKLKQLKEVPIKALDNALRLKFTALNMMARRKEALECAKEWYCLHLTKHTHPRAIRASFAVIESYIHNNEFADAVLYAHITWETITLSRDSHIPNNLREEFTANSALLLAQVTHALAQNGGMPEEEEKEAGVEAIMLTRRALEIHTQLHGYENHEVAHDIMTLAQVLDYFNNVDDDEVPRLYEQAKAIFARQEGSMSPNVATCEQNLGMMYNKRASKAHTVHDLDQEAINLELALPRFIEAIRKYRAINCMDRADHAAGMVADIEELLRQAAAKRAAATRR